MGPAYRRVLLKLSGEALMGTRPFGLDEEVVAAIAEEIADVCQLGIELAIVVGGGNIIRGVTASHRGIERVTGDYMGMLGTVINGLALKEMLVKSGKPARVLSAINLTAVAESFIRGRAIRHLEKGRIVIFVAGTGNPFFTTDTAAALRATEIDADALLKATKVDGIYDDDPMVNPKAKRFDKLCFQEVLDRKLGVMDRTAFSMCMERKIPIVVFNMKTPGHIAQVVQGHPHGTRVVNQL